MPTSYFKNAIEAIEATQAIINKLKIEGNQPNAMNENLNYALSCLNEVDSIYGCTADYEEACEEEFHEKFSNN